VKVRTRDLISALALPALAAFGTWAFLVNRWVIHWVDGSAKTLATAGLALGLGVVSGAPLCFGWRRLPNQLALGVLLLFSAGELRRFVLRSEYRAEPAEPNGAASLLRPVTTTELEVRRFEAPLPKLSIPRLRVLHVSDLHVGEDVPWSYFERILAALHSEEPDLIVLTGDYISKRERLPLLERWLHGMARPRYGSFAVLGNHDHWTGEPDRVTAVLGSAGVEVLRGACKTVALSPGARIRICGTEAPWGPALGRDLADAPHDLPSLVLSHTPDNVYDLAELDAGAVFAGHTHGGQIRLPVLGALIVPSRYGRRFDRGHFVVSGTHLFVSAGVGADAPPLRLWCPPELVVVDFVRRSD